jgi:hypothetical protein
MPGQERTLDGEATPRQILAKQAHLEGRAGKAVYEEHATLAVAE